MRLTFFLGIILIALSVGAQNRVSLSKRIVRPLPKPQKNWAVLLAYGAETDLLQDTSEKAISNVFRVGYLYKIRPWTFGIGSGIAVTTVQTEVTENHTNPVTEDIGVSASRPYLIFGRQRINTSIRVSLPTSDSAKYEQYKGIVRLTADHTYRFTKHFSLESEASLGYVSNEFYFSPVTNEVNPEWLTSLSLSALYRFNKMWSLSADLGAKTTKSLDGSNFLNSTQSISAGFSWQKLSSSLSYVNGPYRDEGPDRFWAFNQHRQLIELGVKYVF